MKAVRTLSLSSGNKTLVNPNVLGKVHFLIRKLWLVKTRERKVKQMRTFQL